MPYIGNNHIAGDHTNNFKVLDDISSYTATFDGSATSVVDTTNNTIRVVEHRFIQGQRVTYTNGGGGNIGGLTTGTAYFVIFDSASTFKLATSASNAANSTAINLSAVGTGSSHTINAAFDGVNTKFKLTHSTGTGARLNNATQVNVAINNVLQKPNQSASYTEGFIIEDNHKIAFKTAPTSEDIFWGSIIANTLTTFDISDHKIDTFTGDGSTTEFTLSHTPANNESLMVTINGVLQHPSNASTARAYTLIASIIQFTAAPGVGDEIQVRHLGFAGATTADVSGFYGRTGNVVLGSSDHITTGDITSRNINASGILTASSASFGGNVSIGGTLTYEDVTNIDSVGIITAQSDIHVGAGLSVAGIGTFNTDTHIGRFLVHKGDTTTHLGFDVPNNIEFTAGNAERLRITNTGNVHFAGDQSGVNRGIIYNGPGYFGLFGSSSGSTKREIRFHSSSSGSDETLRISTGGNVAIYKDLDVDGHTNLDNVSIAGVTTTTGDITIDGLHSGGSSRMLNIGSGNNILRIYENSSQAVQIYTQGNLVLTGATTEIRSKSGSNQLEASFHATNGVKLYHDNNEKLFVNGSGVNITGLTTITQDLDVDGHTNLDNVSVAGVTTFASGNVQLASDSQRLQLGSAQDLWMYHTGTSGGGHGLIQNEYGTMYMLSANWEYRHYGTNQTTLKINGNQSVQLYHTNDSKLATTSTGVTVQGLVSQNDAVIQKDLDVDGHTNLDNVSVAGVSTFSDTVNGTNLILSHATPTIQLNDSNNNPDYVLQNNNGVFRIRDNTNSVDRIVVNTDGKIGINTTSPGRQMHIFSGTSGHPLILERGDGSNTQIEIRAGGAVRGYWGSSSTANFMVYDNDTSDINFVVNQTGDVGIGIDSPRAKLDIEDGGTSQDVILRVSADDNNPYALVVGNDTYNATSNRGLAMWIGGSKIHHITARTSTTQSENTLQIEAYKTSIQTGSSLNEDFVFDENGRLLMQGAAASNAFSGGDDLIIGSTSARSGITLVSATGQDGGLYFSKGTSSNNDHVMGQLVYQHDGDGGYFRHYTNASERLRIAANGDIALRNSTNSHQELQWFINNTKSASIGWGNGSANWEFKHFRNDNQADNPYANIDFYTGDWTTPTRALRITNDGNHIREKHSRFATRIEYSTANEAVDATLDFKAAHVNVGNDFDASNNYYVAPVDGDYAFWFHTNVAKSGSGAYYVSWHKNGSEVNGDAGGRIYDQHSGAGWHNLSGCVMLSLQEGDQITIRNRVVANFDGNSYGQFMGWLVG